MKRLVVFLLVFFLLISPLASAQENGTVIIPTPTPSVDYTLPYPGLLPNHPLYPIKMMRDKIILFLITDPAKKAEFNLLQADKRVQSAIFLVLQKKENGDLAVSTVEKGENYMHDAVMQAIQLNKEKKEVGDLISRLKTATTKHQMVIDDLSKTLPAKSKELAQVKVRVNSYEKQLTEARK